MLHGLLASFQVLGIDEHGEIYRKAFRRPSGFVFAQPAVVHVGIARRQPCRSFRIIVERVSFDQRRITQ
jgi:hypothetical protein